MANLSGYIFLILAITLGILSNGFLKTTNGFTNIVPTIFCITTIILAIFFMAKAMSIIPVGFTYATYGGLTITAVTLFVVFFFLFAWSQALCFCVCAHGRGRFFLLKKMFSHVFFENLQSHMLF